MKADTYYKIYPHVRLVQGAENSILYDFQKSRVVYINHSLQALIELFHQPIQKLKENFEDQRTLFNENIDYLKNKEVLFETNSPDNFPQVEMEHEVPEFISNAVLEYNGSYELDPVFLKLDQLLTKYVELRLHRLPIEEYREVFKSLDKYLTKGIKALQLVVDYNDRTLIDELMKDQDYPKIIRIVYYNAKSSIALLEDSIELCFTKDDLIDIRNAKNDYLSNFVFTSDYFMEAQKYNPYYNKRVCIDHDGTIKNCLKNTRGYGDIEQRNLIEAISSKEFQKLWHARHDLIEDIKDHELRYNMFLTHDLEATENGQFRIIAS